MVQTYYEKVARNLILHQNIANVIFFTLATAKRAIFGTDILWKSCLELDFRSKYRNPKKFYHSNHYFSSYLDAKSNSKQLSHSMSVPNMARLAVAKVKKITFTVF